MNGPGNQDISQCTIVNSMQTIKENCFTYFLKKGLVLKPFKWVYKELCIELREHFI